MARLGASRRQRLRARLDAVDRRERGAGWWCSAVERIRIPASSGPRPMASSGWLRRTSQAVRRSLAAPRRSPPGTDRRSPSSVRETPSDASRSWATTGRAEWEQIGMLPGGVGSRSIKRPAGPLGWVALGATDTPRHTSPGTPRMVGTGRRRRPARTFYAIDLIGVESRVHRHRLGRIARTMRRAATSATITGIPGHGRTVARGNAWQTSDGLRYGQLCRNSWWSAETWSESVADIRESTTSRTHSSRRGGRLRCRRPASSRRDLGQALEAADLRRLPTARACRGFRCTLATDRWRRRLVPSTRPPGRRVAAYRRESVATQLRSSLDPDRWPGIQARPDPADAGR